MIPNSEQRKPLALELAAGGEPTVRSLVERWALVEGWKDFAAAVKAAMMLRPEWISTQKAGDQGSKLNRSNNMRKTAYHLGVFAFRMLSRTDGSVLLGDLSL